MAPKGAKLAPLMHVSLSGVVDYVGDRRWWPHGCNAHIYNIVEIKHPKNHLWKQSANDPRPHGKKTCLRGVANSKGTNLACASGQTDQRLYYSLFGKYHI